MPIQLGEASSCNIGLTVCIIRWRFSLKKSVILPEIQKNLDFESKAEKFLLISRSELGVEESLILHSEGGY